MGQGQQNTPTCILRGKLVKFLESAVQLLKVQKKGEVI